jgi:hypothetical protein
VLLVVHSYGALLGFHGSKGIAFVENGSLSGSSSGFAGARNPSVAGLGLRDSLVASAFLNPSGTQPLVARLKKLRTVHTPSLIPHASSNFG